MTPKEKANKLIKLYEDQNYFDEISVLENAKYNALLCVEQIKQSWIDDGITKFNVSILHWWDKVIVEINNTEFLC